jgi:hypothetical protein
MRTLTRLLLASTAMATLAVGSAEATPSTIAVTGTYTTSYSGSFAPTIFDVLSSPFTENLALNSPTTLTNFIGITPANLSGSHTATGTVTVTFNFTKPSGITGTAVDTGVYTANYYSGRNAPDDTDSIVWNSPDPIVVNFTDGAVLDVTLKNTSDWTLYPQITFDLVKDPSAPVPEPMSIALLGAGLIGLGIIRHRWA